MEDVETSTLILSLIPVIAFAVAKALARSIPDTATGILGIVRKLAAMVALHVKDKES